MDENENAIYMGGQSTGERRLYFYHSFTGWRWRKAYGLKRRAFSFWIKIGLVGGIGAAFILVQFFRWLAQIIGV